MVEKYDGILSSKMLQSITNHFQIAGLLADSSRAGKYITKVCSQQMYCRKMNGRGSRDKRKERGTDLVIGATDSYLQGLRERPR